MVNESINIKKRGMRLKKFLKVFIPVFIIILIILIAFFGGFLLSSGKSERIVLENPMKDIVYKNTNEAGEVDKEKVVEEGVMEFNKDYISYLLLALGVDSLHKALVFGNPRLELDLGEEAWSSEIIDGSPVTQKKSIDDEDLRISMEKKVAVEALLSEDIEGELKKEVSEGSVGIEMIAGKTELFSKGYFGMYKDLTGEEIDESEL